MNMLVQAPAGGVAIPAAQPVGESGMTSFFSPEARDYVSKIANHKRERRGCTADQRASCMLLWVAVLAVSLLRGRSRVVHSVVEQALPVDSAPAG